MKKDEFDLYEVFLKLEVKREAENLKINNELYGFIKKVKVELRKIQAKNLEFDKIKRDFILKTTKKREEFDNLVKAQIEETRRLRNGVTKEKQEFITNSLKLNEEIKALKNEKILLKDKVNSQNEQIQKLSLSAISDENNKLNQKLFVLGQEINVLKNEIVHLQKKNNEACEDKTKYLQIIKRLSRKKKQESASKNDKIKKLIRLKKVRTEMENDKAVLSQITKKIFDLQNNLKV